MEQRTVLYLCKHILTESSVEHKIWGLEQTAVQFCEANDRNKLVRDGYGIPLQSHNLMCSADSSTRRDKNNKTYVESRKEKAKSRATPKSGALPLFEVASLQSSSSSSSLGGFHHVLFQQQRSSSVKVSHNLFSFIPESEPDSAASLLPEDLLVTEMEDVEEEDNVTSDESDTDTGKYISGTLSSDNYRYAKLINTSTNIENGADEDIAKRVMVRVDGGWMVRSSSDTDILQVIPNRKALCSSAAMDDFRNRLPSNISKELVSEFSIRKMSLEKEENCPTFAPLLDQKYYKMLVDSVASIRLPTAAHATSSKRKAASISTGDSTSVAPSSATAINTKSTAEMSSACYTGESTWTPIWEATNPVICPLPCLDGGVRIACAVPGYIPRSMHDVCTSTLQGLCGYCLQSIKPNRLNINQSIATSEGSQNCNSPRQQLKKQKKSKGLLQQQSAVDCEDGAMRRANVVAGAVSYDIHAMCHYALSHPMDFILSDTSDDEQVINPVTGKLTMIEVGSMYQYDEPNDADCDLCGRMGGILYFYTLSDQCTRLPAPSEEGWLAHVPCIFWLVKSGLIGRCQRVQLQSSNSIVPASENIVTDIRPERIVEVAEVTEVVNTSNVGQIASLDAAHVSTNDNNPAQNVDVTESLISTITASAFVDVASGHEIAVDACTNPPEHGAATANPSEPEGARLASLASCETIDNKSACMAPVTSFPLDELYGKWRCSLCGLQAGLCIRCAAIGCTVRAHALCAMQSTDYCKPGDCWALYSVPANSLCPSIEQDADTSIPCLLCPVHALAT